MVTITFSGDAEEVLLEMQRLVNMKKVEKTPKKEAKKVTKAPNEEPKKETPKLKEAPKPEEAKQGEPKKEEPKQGEPKKEEPKQVEEAPKPKETPKPEEPKQDDTGDAPMTEEQTAELRTLCMNYCKKVPDGKERIKQLLKGKGCARVTDLKQKDIPEFKALVQI